MRSRGESSQVFHVLRYPWQPEARFNQKLTALPQVHIMPVVLLHPKWAQRLRRSAGAGGRGDDLQSLRRADEVQPRPQSWEKTRECETASTQAPVDESKANQNVSIVVLGKQRPLLANAAIKQHLQDNYVCCLGETAPPLFNTAVIQHLQDKYICALANHTDLAQRNAIFVVKA